MRSRKFLGGGIWARPQKGHEASCHHVRAELYGGGVWGAGSPAVQASLPPLGTQGDLPHPLLCVDLPGQLGAFGKVVYRPAKGLVAAADGEQRVQGPALPRAPDVGVVRLVLPGVRVIAPVVRRGGVVGGEEGVGTVDQPGVAWCMIVRGGEGVVSVVHEGHVR